ncbi:unnamed protein product [Closterium sp. NIES-64]|nr:unnamed protein product [Closterium sp. NIES-64]
MIATGETHRQITKPIVGLRRVLGGLRNVLQLADCHSHTASPSLFSSLLGYFPPAPASPLAEAGGYRRGVGAERGRDWRNPRAGCRLAERRGKVRLAEVGDRSPFCLTEVGETAPFRRVQTGESGKRLGSLCPACGEEMGLPEGMWYPGVPCTPVSTIKCGTDGNAIGIGFFLDPSAPIFPSSLHHPSPNLSPHPYSLYPSPVPIPPRVLHERVLSGSICSNIGLLTTLPITPLLTYLLSFHHWPPPAFPTPPTRPHPL